MQTERIEHNSRELKYRAPFGAVAAGTTVRLGIFARLSEPISEAVLRLWQDGSERIVPLSETGDGIWSAETLLTKSGLVWYYFRLTTATRTIFYGNNAEQLGGIGMTWEKEPPSFQITVFEPGAVTPDWFKHSVVYQIFPDRFARSGKEFPEKKGAVIHTTWSDTPYYFRDGITHEVLAYDFFGGNLAGIREKLPYLAELGITTVYLNPVFEAESNHRYDTGDYHKIDAMLGSEADFCELIAEGRKYGISFLLDGVFSHTGSNSRYFNQKGEYQSLGAVQTKESPYYPWYKFKSYPDEYEAWWGVKNLPEVNETEPSYLDYIVENPDSVLNHWQKTGISGWRLDVIDELPEEFLRAFYKKLKENSPEAVLIGEVWEDASNKISYGRPRRYFCGGETDSVMNYPLRSVILDFLLGLIDASAAMEKIESLRENYPAENYYALLNILGSHDVERLLTVLGEGVVSDTLPDSVRGRARLSKEQRALAVRRLKLATLWQFTMPGVPSVYYGDEAGVEGQKDPFNRTTFPWGNEDRGIFDWYKSLIRLRKEHPALRTGKFVPLKADGDVLSYARIIGPDGRDMFGNWAAPETVVVTIDRRNEPGSLTEAVTVQAVGTPSGSRAAGVLLHITSLPSRYGIGDLGANALAFVDFLSAAGQSVWQLLPLQPVDYTGSPYQSPSAFAGNPLLIDLDWLAEQQLLTQMELKQAELSGETVDFAAVERCKERALRLAFKRLPGSMQAQIDEFALREAGWLDDYALYQAGKRKFGNKAWQEWAEPFRNRRGEALCRLAGEQAEEIAFTKFVQYVFAVQWARLHDYAGQKGIRLFGDMPLFLANDSADVWAKQEYFTLGIDGRAVQVAGVPPDYFSKTGQRWGNPLYDWAALEKDAFQWWKARFKRQLALTDIVRLDHFRGLEAFWAIDAEEETAQNGHWVKAPGKELLQALSDELGRLPLVAEDLGIITEEVTALREDYALPGMKVLEFEILDGQIGFAPQENTVAYTGTHDNNTLLGWYQADISAAERKRLQKFTGQKDDMAVCAVLQEVLLASPARLAVMSLQDVLLLDGGNRLNTPGTNKGNWAWRLAELPNETAAAQLRRLTERYGRVNNGRFFLEK